MKNKSRKSNKKHKELGKKEPMAYMVFCPSGEYDYRIFADKIEAETVAEEYNEQEDTGHYSTSVKPIFLESEYKREFKY